MLEPNCFYHILNHANGSENIFREDENYRFFLEKYDLYISPVADTLAFCLMPNHFHLLVKIKELEYFKILPKFQTLEELKEDDIKKYISKQFSNLFSSYTQAYNKVYNRMGSLFIKNFKRYKIESQQYLTSAFIYIHNNPVNHGFCNSAEKWKFSSYNTYLSNDSFKINEEEVLELFDDIENFKFCHQKDCIGEYSKKLNF